LLGAASFLVFAAASVAAESAITIPSMDLKSALDQYVKLSNVQLVYRVDEVSSLKSHAVVNAGNPNDALDMMLQGTGVRALRDSNGAVVVSKRHGARTELQPSSAMVLARADGPVAGNAATTSDGTGTATETVTVTGSRVIVDSSSSPTALTVVSAQQLQMNTPSNMPDALNKLPVFQGSNNPRAINNASMNTAGNVLNLRNFGSQRTLILLDGRRVAPTNADGTVDVDTLPQALISRVDVVTGGASAVYGSDAVTGVVNFVLDKKFTGFKVDANSGISSYGDALSYKLGLTAGTDLFGGRGHLEGAVQYFRSEGVPHNARPEGPNYWLLTGAGTAANPFASTINARQSPYAFGGKITCSSCTVNGITANGMQFVSPGVVGPFNPGTATGTSGISSGGDGIYDTISQITAGLTTNESFARFSYNVDDTTTFYVQGAATESYDKAGFTNWSLNTGTAPNTFYKNNAFLSPAAATALGNNGGTAGNTFQLAEFIVRGPHDGFQTNGRADNVTVTTGFEGTLLGKFEWDVYYTHDLARLKIEDPTNLNNQKLYAAEDAVLVGGAPTCYAATQAATAAAYAGCVPINVFGPGMVTKAMADYLAVDTWMVLKNELDDIGGSISGDLFDLPAGTVKGALSAESRWMSYEVQSNAVPSATVDCTGLRLCNPSVLLYSSNVGAALKPVSENVYEFAAEVDVPLVKDQFLMRSLSLNAAGRYTNYSTSGSVETWKAGIDWHIDDSFRLRATNSVDIRAPTLNDMFAPVQISPQTFTDIHVVDTAHGGANPTQTVNMYQQGNAALVPEVARTYTAGIVVTPTMIPDLSASLDYYNITLKNAITTLSASSTPVKQTCESSGGTSPLCALYVRPLPFSDHTTSNFVTRLYNMSLNAADQTLEGFDFEVNYAFNPGDVVSGVPGAVKLRFLANYQPVNESVQYAGAPTTLISYPKGHITGFFNYSLGDWEVSVQDRWFSDYTKVTQAGQVYVDPMVGAVNYIDATVDRKVMLTADSVADVYLSVQNITNTRPPVDPINGTNPGLYFMSAKSLGGANQLGYDAIGRYFTIGIRANW
jgi:outer membrane receptor protein involved in Fe transport